MSLPTAWVDRIFDRANLTWGHQFLARWDGLDIAKVKAQWAHDLACFAQSPNALWWALDHLPAKPVNAVEFRELVRQAPGQHFAAPGPRILEDVPRDPVDPAAVAAELKRLREDPITRGGENREWARQIVARHRAGDRATPTVLAMAQEALGLGSSGSAP